MSDNPDEDHLDWVRSLIAARAPEIGPADIVEAFTSSTEAEPDPGAAIWIEIGEQVLDAVEALDERLTRIEEGLRR